MKAAVVSPPGGVPAYADFRDPPEPGPGQLAVRVTAAALSQVTRSRSAGTHYSGRGVEPFVAGVDGVGVIDGSARRVYFVQPDAPFGSMAERAVVDGNRLLDVPDGVDDATAAAIAIPGMSSWAALTERARLVRGETVLVNGATGSSGRLAVQVARLLGAGRVVATGRNVAILKALEAEGADATVCLGDVGDAFERELQAHFERGIDVVLDYLWGASAERVIVAAAQGTEEGRPIRFVQIGAASGPTLMLPSAALRSSALELMGSGMRSIALPALLRAIAGVLDAAAAGTLSLPTAVRPLSEVASCWEAGSEARLVFVP
ncbi:MAG: zinc-binding alcohol dehydrogenase family protein [Proteobacteria bacterium]|nr:zinc-binding alcohol dehydrogenase family protein [Pseudomonadota bacterium]